MEVSVMQFILAMVAASALATPAVAQNQSPYWTSLSSEFHIVDLNVQNSLTLSGTAVDPDVSQTIHFTPVIYPSFMQFTPQDGNPAHFTLTATGLTSEHIGGYSVIILMQDNGTPMNGDSAWFRIAIIPEPSSLCGAATLLGLRRRRR